MLRSIRALALVMAVSIQSAHATTDQEVAGELVQPIHPIVIEAEKPKSSTSRTLTTNVESGIGSKTIDPSINDLGIEQKNMENLEIISVKQATGDWWLEPILTSEEMMPYSNSWKSQWKTDLSRDQKMKGRVLGNWQGHQFQLEGGFFQNNRKITYVSNSNNPYDSSGNDLAQYPYHQAGGYAKVTTNGEVFNLFLRSLTDFDTRNEDVYAGPIQIGRKAHLQASVNGKLNIKNMNFSPFIQVRGHTFDSNANLLLSNQTQGLKFGIQNEWLASHDDFILLNSVSRETLDRTFNRANNSNGIDGSASHFGRYHGKIAVHYNPNSAAIKKWIELKNHVSFEMVLDQVDLPQSFFETSLTEFNMLWDAGTEVSTSYNHPLGWNLKARRFSLFPTPSQRFGDGALLMGSPQLPLETGVRVSTGPWYKTKTASVALLGFTEQSNDSPIMVAVSANIVRTLPLGGVWTRGLQLTGSVTRYSVTFKSNVTLQDAVNASQINWQRGQSIPGRPKFITNSEIEYNQKGVKVGVRHFFKSIEALDLGGMWFQSPQHKIDAWVGYGKKNWELRLLTLNLIPNYQLPQSLRFLGSAGPNLLEPNIQQREIRLICEFLI